MNDKDRYILMRYQVGIRDSKSYDSISSNIDKAFQDLGFEEIAKGYFARGDDLVAKLIKDDGLLEMKLVKTTPSIRVMGIFNSIFSEGFVDCRSVGFDELFLDDDFAEISSAIDVKK